MIVAARGQLIHFSSMSQNEFWDDFYCNPRAQKFPGYLRAVQVLTSGAVLPKLSSDHMRSVK